MTLSRTMCGKSSFFSEAIFSQVKNKQGKEISTGVIKEKINRFQPFV